MTLNRLYHLPKNFIKTVELKKYQFLLRHCKYNFIANNYKKLFTYSFFFFSDNVVLTAIELIKKFNIYGAEFYKNNPTVILGASAGFVLVILLIVILKSCKSKGKKTDVKKKAK